MSLFNIADRLREIAEQQPDHPAVVFVKPGTTVFRLSFRELNELVDRYAKGLINAGMGLDDRVLIMARPDKNFVPFILGLIRAGCVVVMVDPGRPLRELLTCIKEAAPKVIVAGPFVHAFSNLFPHVFGKVEKRIVVSGNFPGAIDLESLLATKMCGQVHSITCQDSEAAIIFTTGSTGKPKGVIYSHQILQHQLNALRAELSLSGAETGLFGASAMMLLGLMSGVTAVLADCLNASPLYVDVRAYTDLLVAYRITISFSSPALCRRLLDYAAVNPLTFPNLCKLVVGGAPVDSTLICALQSLLPQGDVVVSLGATEAMPVAMIWGQDAKHLYAKNNREFSGVCCGYPADKHELQIISIQDGIIETWGASLCLPRGQIGEIVIRGPVVTGGYLQRSELMALAKIQEGDTVWHRLGDVGFLDDEGCLWFCGRKSQRVETGREVLFTIPCEDVFNRHPQVSRSALIGLGCKGAQSAVIVIEIPQSLRRSWQKSKIKLANELLRP